MASSEITIKSVGVRLKSPAVVVVYETGSGTLHKRTMPVRGLFENSDVKSVAEALRDRHSAVLSAAPLIQVEKMLRILQENMKGAGSLEECLAKVNEEFTVNPDEDLNKLDDETLRRKKDLMSLSFEKSRKKPGDPDFQYDVEEDFDIVAAIETSGWDSDKSGDFDF
ncbi:centrosomal protein of 19 kDa [Rhipicephalus sanguineus]|uniref:Centrosomal protein of 19 kDa n=1 Tax=Rhipicephalus sanguineus TaxID=34632 RepID=A0A9D4SY19_RHISA|nr:centrosomal protein of 19 kDa [Rhipicephalus sanguineus]KAH7961215.1 hypothetical protein HPB52_005844 [Rhipicephalus sanguineus]